MRRLKQFNLFTTKDNSLYIPPTKEKYAIIFLSENTKSFFDTYDKLNINKRFVRDYYLPRFIFKSMRFIPTSADKQKIKRNFKLFPFIKDDNLFKMNRSFYFDYTPYTNFLLKKYNKFKNKSVIKYYNSFLDNYVSKFRRKGYKIIFIYHVNLNLEFDKNIFNRKIFPLLYDMKYDPDTFNNFGIDNFMLATERNNNITYRMIYRKEDKANNTMKVLNLMKQLKVIQEIPKELIPVKPNQNKPSIIQTTNAEPPSESPTKIIPDVHVAKNTINNLKKIGMNNKDIAKEVELNPAATTELLKKNQTLNKPTIKMIADSNAKKNNENPKKVYNDMKQSKEEIAKNIIQHTYNNASVQSISNALQKNNIKEVVKTASENIVPTVKLVSTSSQPMLDNIDMVKLVGSQVKTNVLVKRIAESEMVIDNMITEIFKTHENETHPVKLIKMTKKLDYDKPSEILKSITWNYNVKLRLSNGKIQKLNFKIPAIIDNNYIYINGMKKLVINQAVANPIYFFKKYFVYIRSAYSTIKLEWKQFKVPYFELYIGGVKLPLFLAIILSFPNEVIREKFYINITDKLPEDKQADFVLRTKTDSIYFILDKDDYKFLLHDIKHIASNALTIKNNKFFWIMLSNKVTKDNNSKFKISTVHEHIIDDVTKSILLSINQPTNILDIYKYVIPKLMEGYFQSRNDLTKMRVRSSELMTIAVKKIFDLSYYKYAAKAKILDKNAELEFNSQKIMSMILQSSLTQTADYVNPLRQVSSISKITYFGYGGLDSNSEMLEVRSLHPSYFGVIDPVDTPIYSTIGMNQTLTTGVVFTSKHGHIKIQDKLDSNLRSGMLGLVANMIPFIQNNEPARCMMSCGQQKQALYITKNEVPAVRTGFESIVGNYCSSEFIVRSPVNGIVKDVTDKFIIIEDINKKLHHIKIGRIVLKSGQSYHSVNFIKSAVKKGQKVKLDDIVGYNEIFRNGDLANGKNLLAAFMPYKGANYEDGVVIRKGFAEDNGMTSKHSFVYEIFLHQDDKLLEYDFDLDQKLEVGHVLLKFLPANILELVGDLAADEISENQEIQIKTKNGLIYDIEVFCNHNKIEGPLKTLVDKYCDPKLIGKYQEQGIKIDGTLIRVYTEIELKLSMGDKLTNRAGNKGVITLLEDDDKMPVTPWGEKLDIILNPLGIYSRMNPGQLLELYCGLISRTIQKKMNEMNRKDFYKLMSVILPLLDGTKTKKISKNLLINLQKMSENKYELLKKEKFFPIIVPPFESPHSHQIKKVMDILKLKESYQVQLPEFGIKSMGEVPIGYIFVSKLEHLSLKKLNARSIGSYSKKTGQPHGKNKGQKVGELDTWSLMSYSADNILNEFFGPASDDKFAKQKMIQDIIEKGYANLQEKTYQSNNIDLIRSYMAVAGLLEE